MLRYTELTINLTLTTIQMVVVAVSLKKWNKITTTEEWIDIQLFGRIVQKKDLQRLRIELNRCAFVHWRLSEWMMKVMRRWICTVSLSDRSMAHKMYQFVLCGTKQKTKNLHSHRNVQVNEKCRKIDTFSEQWAGMLLIWWIEKRDCLDSSHSLD